MKLSAQNVVVSELGKTASVTQSMVTCSDIIAETAITGFRAEIIICLKFPPFLFLKSLGVRLDV